jgi:hypothetical protein
MAQQEQTSVALSTVEEEYIAACSASCEVVWLRKLLAGLFDLELEVTCIFCDNQSCIKLSENPVFHDKSKHIEIKYHYILRHGTKGSSEAPVCCYRRADSRCVDQAFVEDKV